MKAFIVDLLTASYEDLGLSYDCLGNNIIVNDEVLNVPFTQSVCFDEKMVTFETITDAIGDSSEVSSDIFNSSFDTKKISLRLIQAHIVLGIRKTISSHISV